MHLHTLALLSAIFIVASFSVNIGIGLVDPRDRAANTIAAFVFGLPATVFIVWTLLTIIF